jgi:hypothetical protein
LFFWNPKLFNHAKLEVFARLMKISVSWGMAPVYWYIVTGVSSELTAYIFRVVREEFLDSKAFESVDAV